MTFTAPDSKRISLTKYDAHLSIYNQQEDQTNLYYRRQMIKTSLNISGACYVTKASIKQALDLINLAATAYPYPFARPLEAVGWPWDNVKDTPQESLPATFEEWFNS